MHCSKSIFGVIVVAALAVAGADAAPATGSPYDQCLARTQNDPAGALLQAGDWAKTGGGGAADHCAALALVGLHRFAEAGVKLDALGRSAFAASGTVRMTLFDQAGNAWLLAGRPDSAIVSFSAALAVDPLDADLLADRARANGFKHNWAKAESDLSAALMVNPSRADIYVLRGSARHALGRKADARADFDNALKIDPRNADALVERGATKYEGGDIAGARADWQAAATYQPSSPAAETARQHLADSAPVTQP